MYYTRTVRFRHEQVVHQGLETMQEHNINDNTLSHKNNLHAKPSLLLFTQCSVKKTVKWLPEPLLPNYVPACQ